VNDFSQKYGVRSGNVRKVIELLAREGYLLKLPSVLKIPLKEGDR